MHSLVFVLIPPHSPDLYNAVSTRLQGSHAAPNRVYPTYTVQCGCINRVAMTAGFTVFDGTCLGKSLLKQLKRARQDDDRLREDELLKQRYQGASNLAQMHSLYDQFDPCCELCGGTGRFVQSSDPAIYYDYWGIEAVDAVLSEQGCAVAALIDPQTGTYRILPAAIVTPEGEWYEGGIFLQSRFDQYQTGREKQPLANWESWATALLDQYREWWVVAVDVHS
jgi:hypothetical protein